MKTLIFIISAFFLTTCSDRRGKANSIAQVSTVDTLIKHDTVFISNDNIWQRRFGLTNDPETDSVWGKPVKFYIDNPKCSPIAKDFYQGSFRPSDNYTTEALLKLAMVDDINLRPFYRWCLYKTIQIQDGALAEYTGIPARQYAEKFPKEFFAYIDSEDKNQKYQDWVGAISYSGFYDEDDYRNTKIIRHRITEKMTQNCVNCNEETIRRIVVFAKDCFP